MPPYSRLSFSLARWQKQLVDPSSQNHLPQKSPPQLMQPPPFQSVLPCVNSLIYMLMVVVHAFSGRGCSPCMASGEGTS